MVLQNFHAVQNVEPSSPTETPVGVAAAGAAAGVARVRIVVLLRGPGAGAAGRMSSARVADQDLLCLDAVTATAVGRAGINGMTVVDATTNGVAFDYLDTHDGGCNGSSLLNGGRLKW